MHNEENWKRFINEKLVRFIEIKQFELHKIYKQMNAAI